MEDQEMRIYNIERDMANFRDRLATVENSAKGAWNTLRETKDDVDNLYDEIGEMKKDIQALLTKQNSMEADMKDIKVTQTSMEKTMKWMTWAIIGLFAVVALAGFFSWKNGSDVPEKVVEAVVPIMKEMLPK